jgi:hypothetical protein
MRRMWIREGHPKAEVTRLATEIASAVTGIAGVPPTRAAEAARVGNRGPTCCGVGE